MIEEFKFTAQSAQYFVDKLLEEGDIAVDATCGNGGDTLFLAQKVGPEGKVWAFDIQDEAIAKTRQILKDKNYNNVELIRNSHENIKSFIPDEFQGKVKAIMFNLGFLPGSDHTIKTNKDSTLKAVNECLDLLSEPGIITICVYPHSEGVKEGELLKEELRTLSGNFNVLEFSRLNRNNPPYLIIITKG